MSIRIAIVDDLKKDRDRLEELIRAFFADNAQTEVKIASFASAEEFLPIFSPEDWDLAFLDICMDEMDGIQLAQTLREQDSRLMIVFQTTERSYAFDAFPLHPFDYLVKPCVQEDVESVLKEALRVLDAGDPEISIVAVRASYNVPLRSIIAISSQGHNVELSLIRQQSITSTETFKSIEEKLEGDPRFLLINRGVMVNMDHVLSPDKDGMKMKDGSLYPIRVNGRGAVLSAFSQYMISKVNQRS